MKHILLTILIIGLTHIHGSNNLYDQALLAFYKENYAQTVKHLNNIGLDDVLDIQILKAHALIKLGQNDKARQHLASIKTNQLLPNPDYVAYLQIQIALQDDEIELANAYVNQLSQTENDGLLYDRAQIDIGSYWQSKNDYHRAERIYKKLIETRPNTQTAELVLAKYTQMMIDQTNSKHAINQFKLLIKQYPQSKHIDPLYQSIQKKLPKSQVSQYIDDEFRTHLGVSYYQNNQFKQALTVLSPVKTDPIGLFHLGMSYYMTYDFGKAIQLFKSIGEDQLSSKLNDKRQFYMARSYHRSRSYSIASKQYKQVASNKQSNYRAESYHYLYQLSKRSPKQSNYYLSILKTKFRDSQIVNKLIWNRAKQFILSKQWHKAHDALNDTSEQSSDQILQSEMVYWRAKALRYQSKASAANPILKSGVEQYPYSYYAYQTVNRFFPSMDLSNEKSLLKIESRPLDDRYKWLVRMGLADLAIDLISRRYQQSSNQDQISLMYQVSHIHQLTGNYYESIWSIRRRYSTAVYPQKDLEVPLAFQPILYPRPYWELIKKYAKKYNLDPNLVIALIREESLFNQSIKSRSNAIGLMQIMPSTGKEVARKIGIKWTGESMLKNPHYNIQIGCYYLSWLIKQFNGDLSLAVASYNAGPNATKRWIKRFGAADIDLFLLRIPYPETKNYVKNVLQSFWIYTLRS